MFLTTYIYKLIIKQVVSRVGKREGKIRGRGVGCLIIRAQDLYNFRPPML